VKKNTQKFPINLHIINLVDVWLKEGEPSAIVDGNERLAHMIQCQKNVNFLHDFGHLTIFLGLYTLTRDLSVSPGIDSKVNRCKTSTSEAM
jgi:hypothetical protein